MCILCVVPDFTWAFDGGVDFIFKTLVKPPIKRKYFISSIIKKGLEF